ncbi:hypothetical protein CJ030_MR1G019314 [Morella rubra]|uniref:SnoaL-like domain-containing protein n=1 Tax=Morella rubra TaxID=262757 RepID=A0A6A1WJH1_9ROSI|nr:hypothetical protein CJ030_MR1G019314 [Morella rubra]
MRPPLPLAVASSSAFLYILKASFSHCFHSQTATSLATHKLPESAMDDKQSRVMQGLVKSPSYKGNRVSYHVDRFDSFRTPLRLQACTHRRYGSCATPRDFEIYAPDATFEDPLMSAKGVKQIKSAFYSLSKVFGESRIVEFSVQENVISPGKREVLIDNKQHYKFLGKNIDVISLIKLDIVDGKVVRHEDWWDKKPLLNRETAKLPLVGHLVEMSRRGSMLATHAMMRFGKDPTM